MAANPQCSIVQIQREREKERRSNSAQCVDQMAWLTFGLERHVMIVQLEINKYGSTTMQPCLIYDQHIIYYYKVNYRLFLLGRSNVRKIIHIFFN